MLESIDQRHRPEVQVWMLKRILENHQSLDSSVVLSDSTWLIGLIRLTIAKSSVEEGALPKVKKILSEQSLHWQMKPSHCLGLGNLSANLPLSGQLLLPASVLAMSFILSYPFLL